ncbi:MAG: hypothetical protein M1827_002723 [Pycnora praestabilis]|nr:MAG: hypothetical protein M1827_002723 [Pycnora praestabilis]
MSQIREQTWSLLGDAFQQWKIFIIPGFVMYLALVTRLRHKRAKSLPKRFNYTSRDTYSKMTTDDAQAILKELTELEFPKFMGFSIIFALFKTYGIPSVSSLLVSTGQLANPETASRRTADTGVLLLEFALNKPSSERTIQAISRMNYLHSRYQKSGKITNADMLYTLSLFALEPSRWVDKYEWRSMTELELCASGTFWKAMGDAMLIPYDVLPSCKIGWEDGLDWLKEVEDWSLRYEAASMLPAPSNNQLAGSHVEVLFLNLPSGLMEAGKQIMAIFLGERLRKAML